MQVVVIKHYEQPYENPISVAAGDAVTPDFDRDTNIEGWVWCTAKDARSGWAPRNWLVQSGDAWRVDREFNAIELTIVPGELLDVVLEESGFFWVTKQDGKAGWVPCDHVSVVNQT